MGVTGGVVPFWNWRKPHAEGAGLLFFRPAGALRFSSSFHSLRCGLHSCAAFAAGACVASTRESLGPGSPLIVKDRHYPMDNEFVFSLSNWKHGINENSMQAASEFGSGRVKRASQGLAIRGLSKLLRRSNQANWDGRSAGA